VGASKGVSNFFTNPHGGATIFVLRYFVWGVVIGSMKALPLLTITLGTIATMGLPPNVAGQNYTQTTYTPGYRQVYINTGPQDPGLNIMQGQAEIKRTEAQTEQTRLENQILQQQIDSNQSSDRETFSGLYNRACQIGIPDLVLCGELAPIFDEINIKWPQARSIFEKFLEAAGKRTQSVYGADARDVSTFNKGYAVILIQNGQDPVAMYCIQASAAKLKRIIIDPQYRNPSCGATLYHDWLNFRSAMKTAGWGSN